MYYDCKCIDKHLFIENNDLCKLSEQYPNDNEMCMNVESNL